MKVGFIVESGPKGAETDVIPFLAKVIEPTLDTDVVPMVSKKVLRKQCGEYAAQFLADGCDIVLIVWDLLPDWGEYDGKGCLHDDRLQIFQSLKSAGINEDDQRVRLVCIHNMLESWLIADERAVDSFLSTAAHSIKVSRHKNPEAIKDPKSAMIAIFKKSRCHLNRYEDSLHAYKIAKLIPDLCRLDRLDSFKRFRDKLN
jgi:hypothetical protein